jgi:hypothetical protein
LIAGLIFKAFSKAEKLRDQKESNKSTRNQKKKVFPSKSIVKMQRSLKLSTKLFKESWRNHKLSVLIPFRTQLVSQHRVQNQKLQKRKQRKLLTAVLRKLRISIKMKVDNVIILIIKRIYWFWKQLILAFETISAKIA